MPVHIGIAAVDAMLRLTVSPSSVVMVSSKLWFKDTALTGSAWQLLPPAKAPWEIGGNVS